jgi:hypothetical protein
MNSAKDLAYPAAVEEREDERTTGKPNETNPPASDPDWYSEPLVEDSFGQPIFGELQSSSPIFHAEVPPITAPHRWKSVWAGFGCMSDNGLPFDALEMILGMAVLGRQLRCETDLLIADAHALTTGGDECNVQLRAERLMRDLKKIFNNFGVRCHVFLASTLSGQPLFEEYHALAQGWERNLEPGLPPYLLRGMADSAYMASNNCLKLGWSTSPTPSVDEGRFHEPATDLRARQLQTKFGGIYTRPGFTLRGDRPKAVPYTEIAAPEDRFMLTGPNATLEYEGQVSEARRSAKAVRSLASRVSLITDAYENNFGQLKGDNVFQKAESLAKIATRS